jgi:hypothetical protein
MEKAKKPTNFKGDRMKNLTLTLVCLLVTLSVKAQFMSDNNSGSNHSDAPPALPINAEPPPVLEPEPPAVVEPTPLPIVIGEAGYGGSGCTAGNALIEHDDQGLISVLLALMVVDGSSNAAFARSACSVRIPITVPANHKLAVIQVSNSGSYQVDAQDSLTLNQETGFVGVASAPQTLQLSAEGDGVLDWDSSIGQLAESSCEKTEHILALNTNALLRKSKAGATDSQLVLDSTTIQLVLEECTQASQ